MTSRTVAKLCETHLARSKARLKPATQRQHREAWRRDLLPWLGSGTVIDAVRRGAVQEWIDRPDQAARPVQANRTVAVGKAAWNLAAKLEWTERPNPFSRVDKWPEQPRARVLTDEEREALFEHLLGVEAAPADNARHARRRHAARCLLLILHTGLRFSEALNLARSDVREDRIEIPETKTGAKTVWLSPQAIEVLDRTPQSNDRLFPCSYCTVRRTWNAAREAIGAPDLTVHDLRRSYATMLGEAGVPVEDVAALMGQATVSMAVRHYRHLRPDRLRELAGLAGELVAEGVGD